MTDRPTLWGPGEIARAFTVNRSTVSYWRTLDGFPEPQQLAQGPVWFADDVKLWRRRYLAARRREQAF